MLPPSAATTPAPRTHSRPDWLDGPASAPNTRGAAGVWRLRRESGAGGGRGQAPWSTTLRSAAPPAPQRSSSPRSAARRAPPPLLAARASAPTAPASSSAAVPPGPACSRRPRGQGARRARAAAGRGGSDGAGRGGRDGAGPHGAEVGEAADGEGALVRCLLFLRPFAGCPRGLLPPPPAPPRAYQRARPTASGARASWIERAQAQALCALKRRAALDAGGAAVHRRPVSGGGESAGGAPPDEGSAAPRVVLAGEVAEHQHAVARGGVGGLRGGRGGQQAARVRGDDALHHSTLDQRRVVRARAARGPREAGEKLQRLRALRPPGARRPLPPRQRHPDRPCRAPRDHCPLQLRGAVGEVAQRHQRVQAARPGPATVRPRARCSTHWPK